MEEALELVFEFPVQILHERLVSSDGRAWTRASAAWSSEEWSSSGQHAEDEQAADGLRTARLPGLSTFNSLPPPSPAASVHRALGAA